MSSNPTLEHAEFDLYFHARVFAGDEEREREGLKAAALEFARACGWKPPHAMQPIVIDGMGTAVAAKELADVMEARAAKLEALLRDLLAVLERPSAIEVDAWSDPVTACLSQEVDDAIEHAKTALRTR